MDKGDKTTRISIVVNWLLDFVEIWRMLQRVQSFKNKPTPIFRHFSLCILLHLLLLSFAEYEYAVW
jgi:hypothetical protein